MNHKILVVDDKPENIKVLMEILREHYTVIAATNGEKALELAHKEPQPDLILLDVIMPEMDGYEVCKQLKADAVTQHIPVIFVTTINEASGEEIGLNVGAIDYISKPVIPDIVLARVKNHLELKTYRDDLEKRVKEETEKRLGQQELLVRQSRLAAMGEMMSAITHQWGQPLNIVKIATDFMMLLIEESESADLSKEELLEQCRTIHKNIDFMGSTMHDFKNYFKPNKTKKPFNLREEVETVVGMLSSQLKHAQITLHNDIDSNLHSYGIASEFKQVVLNLISNAKDAIKSQTNDKGPGEIQFSARAEGSVVILEAQDDGGGIPKEVIDNIFDDYFTTKGEGGTGIGLSMSKMIIEEGMGGKLSVSNTDKGAKFTLELPTPPARLQ